MNFLYKYKYLIATLSAVFIAVMIYFLPFKNMGTINEDVFKNSPVTEELALRFKGVDKNSVTENIKEYSIWWNDNEGYSVSVPSVESISVSKAESDPRIQSDVSIPDKYFNKELEIVKSVFLGRGFTLNKLNSSNNTNDERFIDYVQAYEKSNYFCTVTVNPNGEGVHLLVGCSDKFEEEKAKQLPFLNALGLKNQEEVTTIISSAENYFQISEHGRRTGTVAIIKKEADKYRVLVVTQEAPGCELMYRERIPKEVLTSIGNGDCYSNNNLNRTTQTQ